MEGRALGALAYAVLEQHSASAEAAVTRVLARMRRELPPDRQPHLVGFVYTAHEVVRQPLQVGNWVTLGEVGDTEATTFVEVNVGTGATRERCA
jgi:hypothetical protein